MSGCPPVSGLSCEPLKEGEGWGRVRGVYRLIVKVEATARTNLSEKLNVRLSSSLLRQVVGS